ncbi:LysR family transcriptional regulator [Bradyrhizobium australafricanum]|uniref:LysR family transcriptional regulator n=1 Tax=Bradyrhizobium australafricanum TaxID=2821406 RepID=UPI001CE2C6B2|nr:LysR family transcriptional regulator [Bradyrhizobium australafricanum]
MSNCANNNIQCCQNKNTLRGVPFETWNRRTPGQLRDQTFSVLPAVSKGVRDLELQLGRLLDRTPKGVRPTREGRALVPHAEALFAAERVAEDELLSLRSLNSGSLRIGASTTIATYMISEYLGAFRRTYPSIHLVIANTRDIVNAMLHMILRSLGGRSRPR